MNRHDIGKEAVVTKRRSYNYFSGALNIPDSLHATGH